MALGQSKEYVPNLIKNGKRRDSGEYLTAPATPCTSHYSLGRSQNVLSLSQQNVHHFAHRRSYIQVRKLSGTRVFTSSSTLARESLVAVLQMTSRAFSQPVPAGYSRTIAFSGNSGVVLGYTLMPKGRSSRRAEEKIRSCLRVG